MKRYLSALRDFYDSSCDWMFGLDKRFEKRVLSHVALQKGCTVLDVGCGEGELLSIIGKQDPNIALIGVDVDPVSLDTAKRNLQALNIAANLQQGSADALPVSSASVDVCVSTMAIHHMQDSVKEKGVQEMHRVLKPGGIVVIADFKKGSGLIFKLLHLFENVSSMKGNVQELILKYLRQNKFNNVAIVADYFPGVIVVKAQK